MRRSARRLTLAVLTAVTMTGGGMPSSPALAVTEPDPPGVVIAHEAPADTQTGGAGTNAVVSPCTIFVLCLFYDSNADRLAASMNTVFPQPGFLSIFNQSTGQRVALCGPNARACERVGVSPGQFNVCHRFVAYRGNVAPYVPPAPVSNTSNAVDVCGPRLG